MTGPADTSHARAGVWNALNQIISDHPMWISDTGQPLDYMPEREALISDFLTEASNAITTVVATLCADCWMGCGYE